MRTLVVTADAALAAGLRASLQAEGHLVEVCTSGSGADRILHDTESESDLVVLDLEAPGLAVLEVLGRLRAHGHRARVLVLAPSAADVDRTVALDEGADDCLARPFDTEAFRTRVQALLGSGDCSSGALPAFGRLAFDPCSRTATVDGAPTVLSNREASVLQALLQGFGRLVTKERLMNDVYGIDGDVGPNTIEVYIHRLRKKLVGSALSLRTVHRRGYLLELERSGVLERSDDEA